jgi:hypothetical protein
MLFSALVGVPQERLYFLPLLVFLKNAFAGVLHLQIQPNDMLLVKNTNSGGEKFRQLDKRRKMSSNFNYALQRILS